MRSTKLAIFSAALCSLLFTAASHAASVSGTVTNKTTGRPSGGDKVELVDVQSGMSTVATATSDASGHYSLNEPGAGPYLIRVTHQGAGYFIAAPQGAGPGDIGVYDAAAKVSGISVEAEIYQVETQNDQLQVSVSWVVHNASSPKVTEFNNSGTFEFELPPDAIVDGAEATRPSGLPTMAVPKQLGQKGHYAFDVPIEPDQADKSTQFQIAYHLPYSGSYTFRPSITEPIDNLAVQLPKSMTFAPQSGASYQSIPQDPAVQTYLLKNALPGKAVGFAVSGTGAMPREQQQQEAGAQQPPQQGPGGGIGEPINQPDPLSKYKWWILGGLALLLAAAAAFLLRRPPLPALATAGAPGAANVPPLVTAHVPPAAALHASPAGKHSALLNTLKEEMFSLESEKLSGTITPEEYAEQKAALETVLKRALKRG
ncbi:MAG TPA: carboxypeptidase-like regulatory domain-containing protein [Terracidiphilus sp.]|nr:carboxypeptidase-like regulatory domain-containing protein [Terracidiphilus sp.]